MSLARCGSMPATAGRCKLRCAPFHGGCNASEVRGGVVLLGKFTIHRLTPLSSSPSNTCQERVSRSDAFPIHVQLDLIIAAKILNIFSPNTAANIPKTAPTTAAAAHDSENDSEYNTNKINVGRPPSINPLNSRLTRFLTLVRCAFCNPAGFTKGLSNFTRRRWT